MKLSIIFGLTGLIIWTIGIPLLSTLILIKRRDSIDTLAVKREYGFLYNGYLKKAFYWELIISWRKIIIAFASIFLTLKGTMVQSLILLFILAISIFITLRVNPYVDFRMNRLEIVSLLSLSLTSYCGVFFLSDRDPQAVDFVHGKDCKLECHISGFEYILKMVSLHGHSYFECALSIPLDLVNFETMQAHLRHGNELLLSILLSSGR